MRINKTIKILIGGDLLINTAVSFLGPVFAIFLVQSIENGTAQVAGTAAAIYWIIKSILRVPIGYFLDKRDGENDGFYSLVGGFFIFSLCYFLFIWAHTPTHIYLIQALAGIAGAFAFTPWYGFFTRHIDRFQENFEWSISVSLTGIGMGTAGYIAGYVADNFGFIPIFAAAGVTSLLGTFLFISMKKYLLVERKDGHRIRLKEKNGRD